MTVEPGRRQAIVFGVAMILVGSALGIYGAIQFRELRLFAEDGVQASAILADKNWSSSTTETKEGQRTTVTRVIEFTFETQAGETVAGRHEVGSRTYHQGEKGRAIYPILYLPDDPTRTLPRADIQNRAPGLVLIGAGGLLAVGIAMVGFVVVRGAARPPLAHSTRAALVFGLLFLFAGTGVGLFGYGPAAFRDGLEAEGTWIEARVRGHGSQRVDEEWHYELSYVFTDPEGFERTGESAVDRETFEARKERRGATLPVVYHPAEPALHLTRFQLEDGFGHLLVILGSLGALFGALLLLAPLVRGLFSGTPRRPGLG